jgi:DNA helicase HerA-like ATPase
MRQYGGMTPQTDRDVSYLGATNFRNRNIQFGIKQSDRLSHIYMIGKTGVGKSTLIEALARQDLSAGRGFALIDPHGDLVEKIAADIPPDHANRVIFLNAPNPSQPYGYNPLRRVRDDKIPLAVSGLLETLK